MKEGLFLIDVSHSFNELEGLINTFSNGVLGLFSAACTILASIQAFGYVKADNTQEKTEAKKKMEAVIAGFVLAFAIIMFVKTAAPSLVRWMQAAIRENPNP